MNRPRPSLKTFLARQVGQSVNHKQKLLSTSGKNRKLLLSFWVLFLFIAVNVSGQAPINSASGVVLDKSTQTPVPFAYVFINGTTFGTQSDENGRFAISGFTLPCQLVVRHVSHNTQAIDLNKNGEQLNVLLDIKIVELREIVVEGVDNRKRNLLKFTSSFLGTDEWGQKARILNDSVLIFSNKSGVFRARASAPLEIELPMLGYRVIAELGYFRVRKVNYVEISSYNAYYYFIPITPKSKKEKETIEENRRMVYYCSPMHFCRSLYKDSLSSNGYLLTKEVDGSSYLKLKLMGYVEGTTIEPVQLKGQRIVCDNGSSYLKLIGYKDSVYTVRFNPKLVKAAKTKVQKLNASISKLYLTKDSCVVWSDGTISDEAVVFDGIIGSRQVGAMLPEDYLP